MSKLTRRDYLFVSVQMLLFLLYAIVPESVPFEAPDRVGPIGWALLVAGLLLVMAAVLQLNTSLSPFPRPVAGGGLVTSGAFAFARHPIYAGLLWAALGNALRAGSGGQLVVTCLLGSLFYFKSVYEEGLLLGEYPEYAAYRGRVGRFWPLV